MNPPPQLKVFEDTLDPELKRLLLFIKHHREVTTSQARKSLRVKNWTVWKWANKLAKLNLIEIERPEEINGHTPCIYRINALLTEGTEKQ